jgi:hypothetical protein
MTRSTIDGRATSTADDAAVLAGGSFALGRFASAGVRQRAADARSAGGAARVSGLGACPALEHPAAAVTDAAAKLPARRSARETRSIDAYAGIQVIDTLPSPNEGFANEPRRTQGVIVAAGLAPIAAVRAERWNADAKTAYQVPSAQALGAARLP